MIHLYTGEGKGKTTAATGLALQALGRGWRVLFVQFMKSVPSGEITMLQRCDEEDVKILREWDDSFIIARPSQKQIAMAKNLWKRSEATYQAFEPDLVVLDEVVVAIGFGLLSEEEVIGFIQRHPVMPEIVLTGRGASPRLIEAADLVTQMQKVKHYYDQGIDARKGIEY